MVIVEFSIIPIGVGTSISEHISKAIKVLEARKVKYQLTAMGTIFEVESLSEALEIILEAHEAVIKAGALRVITNIKIDDRRDKKTSMEDKVKSVMEKLR
ncbi:MAG: MTH1187 family thiamine-binding protein [Candidatus Methanomethylicia archaeon]